MKERLPLSRRRLLGGMAALAGASLVPVKSAGNTSDASRQGAADSPGADFCIQGATVLTMSGGDAVLHDTDVLVRNQRIEAVGKHLAAGDAERIDGRGQIVLPGFVDTHNHLWQTQMRGMFAQSQASLFFPLTQRLTPHFRPEDVRVGTYLGAVENVSAGITTSNDFFDANRSPAHAEAALEALRASGLRARLLYGAESKTTDQSTDLDHLQALDRHWSRHDAGGRLSLGLAWRLPNDLDDADAMAMKRREFDTARELALPIAVHVSGEGHHEMFQALIDGAFLHPALQVVHATDAREAHLAALERAGASLSLTPVTEHRVSYGLTRLSHFEGVTRQGLGIDGNALAGRGDMFSVLRTAALTELGASGDQSAVDCQRLLHLATLGGAESIGMGETIGSLAPGKRADLIMVDTRTLNIATMPREPAATLVFAAGPSDVSLVAIDGRIVKRDGQMQHLEADIQPRTQDSIDHLSRFPG